MLKPLTGVWKDALQMPVEISQVLTIPSESLVIVIPSFACRVIDLISVELSDVDSGSVLTGSDGTSICQNLTDLSADAEMREEEEENAREVI